jgi:tryptophan-rich sensory protein
MKDITPYLPFIIPVAILEAGLMAAALIHIFRHKTYKVGNRPMWVAICLLISTIGPVLYFIIGRSDE